MRNTLPTLAARWRTISTLDTSLDAALGGGVPVGHVTEITGESGAGKTQLLLTLLLSVQLPPARGGLGRPALYLSTEAPLSTVRLSQILRNHPRFPGTDADADADAELGMEKPSLDNIISTVTPDLESQDHILTFQVPVEVARRNVGLVVLDSVAANYRAEFERGGNGSSARGGAAGLAARGSDLVRLGRQLHELARQHNLAVVVSNQVADRFPSSYSAPASVPSSSLPWATPAAPKSSLPGPSTQRQPYPYPRAAVKQSQESPLASRSRRLDAGALPRREKDPEPPTSSVPVPTPPPQQSKGDNDGEKGLGGEDEDDEQAMMAMAAVRSSMPEPAPEDYEPPAPPALLLDHQQRWFTGWGDDYLHHYHGTSMSMKTPSLGLVWGTQLSARVALLKRPVYNRGSGIEDEDADTAAVTGGVLRKGGWRRWMKVVFAPHVAPSAPGLDGSDGSGPVEFDITMGGLKAVERKVKGKGKAKEEF